MGALRAIETESFAPIAAQGDPGPAPMLQWLKIADLWVDDGYQRPLANKGRSTARAIAEQFSWSKFSPVIVAPIEGGKFAIIDGQHRVTGAALRGIESVPCQVVIADRAAQASAFASINGNTTRMTALALHHAAVAARDPEAMAIDRAAAAAGVRVLRGPTAQDKLKPGETMGVVVLRTCLRAYGEPALITGLRCVTASRHNQPGMLGATAVRALAALAAEAPDHEALIGAVGRLPLAAEVRFAEGSVAAGGLGRWSILVERLRPKLRDVLSARVAGSAAPPSGKLSPRETEKAAQEREFVQRKRREGVPWPHIAAQLVVSTLDLRRRHDPEFVA